ncbi:uncharacterized protein LOC115628505 [Scaptodrosophila lebanonensis]|uniref:Uncharacterized protein LOC115628505 n=1 Tax=Drosophila lebanonensis TaxID=7225 RepID=A0A6J2TZ94_DROLE|nr:uncharacterized protein LOC115628505 [Scaptodrosophila lebanonensis]
MEHQEKPQLETARSATPPPQKRKHCEYHDPDYYNNVSSPVRQHLLTPPITAPAEKYVKLEEGTLGTGSNARTDSTDRPNRMADICEIVRREFQKELILKEQQLAEIDARLLKARQMLDKLRYEVVSEYYRKQEVSLTAGDVLKVRGDDTLFSNERAGPQRPLHPAIKKIVGKRPIPDLAVPERTAAVLAKETIRLRNPAHRRAERRRQQKIRKQGIVIDHSQNGQQQVFPAQLHIKSELNDDQPCTSKQALERQRSLDVLETGVTPALNACRLNNKQKFSFIVGNTSKYIGADLGIDDTKVEGEQILAYKWLVYVQGKNLPEPVDAYLKKVRFQLHHSYRPNDIVDVHTPPFQLSRRGWGEFPIRIQLYFQENLQQKPVQLMHTIVLDKTRCGLHTMGAETTVEVWLRAAHTPGTSNMITNPEAPLLTDQENCKPRTISITHNKEELDDNLFACLSKADLSGDIEKIEPTVVVSEPLTCKLKLASPQNDTPKISFNGATSQVSRPSVVFLPVNGSADEYSNSNNAESKERKPNKHLQFYNNGHGMNKKPLKNVFQKAGKLYIIDPLQSKLKQAQRQQQSLLKPKPSLLKPSSSPPPPPQQLSKHWQTLQSIRNDHGYANMAHMSVESIHEISSGPFKTSRVEGQEGGPNKSLRLQQLFLALPFESMRSAVEFLMRRLPLVSNYNEFAFVSPTLESFQKQSVLRQRCFEYLRARLILNCMRQHIRLKQSHATMHEKYWSIREIVNFARVHGYTPALKQFAMKTSEQKEREHQLSQRVQQQLKEEPEQHVLPFASLTSNVRITNWLTQQSKRWLHHASKLSEAQEPIDVVGDEEEAKPCKLQKLPPSSTCNSNNRQLLYLPPPDNLENAAQLVHDMCRDVGITLETEQSVPGVAQPLALTLLAHVLQVFVEKLVRRSVASKLQKQHQLQMQQQCNTMSAQKAVLPLMTVANVETTLLPHDIGRVISQCADFDFLGNSNLGVTHVDLQS